MKQMAFPKMSYKRKEREEMDGKGEGGRNERMKERGKDRVYKIVPEMEVSDF